jgi:hypothetical protein
MAAAIDALLQRTPPSHAFIPGLLDGLPAINDIFADELAGEARRRASIVPRAAAGA